MHTLKKFKFFFLLSIPLLFCSFDSHDSPFDYDLNLTEIPGNSDRTVICFHGMGGDYRIAQIIKSVTGTSDSIVSFNFPDHGLRAGSVEADKTSFGSIQEIIPAIYVLKKVIIEQNKNNIVLYGFSAGAGAIINVLATLNTSNYDEDLQKIGVTQNDKKSLLEVIEQGLIILDAPLKSVKEIIAFRGSSKGLDVIGSRYARNHMEPIDALKNLKNLKLHFIVFFQNPDEIVSNRDDELFVRRLKEVNHEGTTEVVTADDGGHNSFHRTLWKSYLSKTQN